MDYGFFYHYFVCYPVDCFSERQHIEMNRPEEFKEGVLYALQLDDDILLLAQKDEMGRALQDLALKTRIILTK